MEAFEVSGRWWLPEAPEDRISGTLTVSETGSAELVLIGSLRSHMEDGQRRTDGGITTVTVNEDSLEKSGVYPRILGEASAAFTLNDCFRTHRSGQFFGGLDTERIHVHQVFKGLWLDGHEALEFHKIYVQMDWLAYWVMQTGLEESMDFTERQDGIMNQSVTLTVRKIPMVEFPGHDQSVVSLGQTYGVVGDRIVERKLTQDFFFSISYGERVELRRLLEEAGTLQDLVSMGTARKAAYSKVSLRRSDVSEVIQELVHERPIPFFAQWNTGINEEGTRTMNEHDMLFTFQDLGGAEGVSRWLVVAVRNRSALSRVMWCRYSGTMVVTDRLLNCAAALEAYDRDKNADEINYIDRIKRCIRVAGPLFVELVGDADAWAKQLKDSRNAVAHHNAHLDGASTTHLFMSESAYWLFVLCLLQESHAPEAVFSRMKGHRQFRWLRREVAAVLSRTGTVSGGR